MDLCGLKAKADIITYELGKLIAIKLRALYQHRKGCDLFDIGYVTTHNLINLNRVLDIFYKLSKLFKRDYLV
jgi:hypothetical protein